MASPIEQFEIKKLVPWQPFGADSSLPDLSFTNASLWMVIASLAAAALMLWATRKPKPIPSRRQIIAETLHGMIHTMVKENIGPDQLKYVPLIFTLFLLIMFGNTLGLIPGSFTFTSHLAVTVTMALVVFIGVTLLGFIRHKHRFLTFFVPHGTPWFMLPLIIPLEVMSYLSRPVSLSVRLFANMVAGHVLLKVAAGFVFALGFIGIVPLFSLVLVYALELFVAMIQAYVFAILTCIYIHDAIHMHN